MAISFPTSLDNFTNPSSGNTLDSPSHSLQHSDINDAVEALERKIGVGTAVAGSASAGQVLTISAAGTSTWSTPSAGGLVQVVPSSVDVGSGSGSADANGRVTITGASSVSLNGVFSATYDKYKIIVNETGSAAGQARIRLRVAGSDNSAANYRQQYLIADNTGAFPGRDTGLTYWTPGRTMNGHRPYFEFDVINAFDNSLRPTIFSFSNDVITGNLSMTFLTGALDVTTSYTGFSVIAESGTMTGTVSVYGYK